jgi:hypothetical protein
LPVRAVFFLSVVLGGGGLTGGVAEGTGVDVTDPAQAEKVDKMEKEVRTDVEDVSGNGDRSAHFDA